MVVDLLLADGRMAEVQVSGDFFLEPASALDEVDSALQGLPVESSTAELTAAVAAVLEPADGYGITAEGVATAVRRALDAGDLAGTGEEHRE